MWKCIRCNKENPDSIENCTECGHGKSMNYIAYRTLSKVQVSITENWKVEQNTPQYFMEQGREHLQKVIECFYKINMENKNIWDMTMLELNQYFMNKESVDAVIKPTLMADNDGEKELMKAVKDKIETDGKTSEVWKTASLRGFNVCSDENKKRIPVLMADNNMDYVLGSNTFRDKIRKIEFVKINMDLVPDSAWDVSDDKKGSIWAWIENTDSGQTIKIGSENGIYANPDCEGLFQNYMNVTRIEFHNLFNTSQVTSMKGMFSNCFELKELDVSGFDTGNVTDMSKMFFYCRALSKLDASGFRTRYDTTINHMFSGCENLIELDISHFDARKIAYAPDMFEGCVKLKR